LHADENLPTLETYFICMETLDSNRYLKTLKERAGKARITQQFQLIGLEIATTLRDLSHKALYIKYAKEFGASKMLALAKDIAERRDVTNRGAYFMTVAQSLRNTKGSVPKYEQKQKK